MTDAEAEVLLWIVGILMGMIAILGIGVFLHDRAGYSGGSTEPNEWTQL